MRAHLFVFTPGHVEDTCLASLVLWHPEGFTSVERALESLGRVFLELVAAEDAARNERLVCPHCDRALNEVPPPDRDDVEERIRAVMGGTLDTEHDLVMLLEDEGWSFVSRDIPQEHRNAAVYVHQYAESILGDVAFGRTIEGEDGWVYAYDWAAHILAPEGLPLEAD